MENNLKPIFIHSNGFSFAWSGGRFLIIDPNFDLIDFSDGGGGKGYAKFVHSKLKLIEARDTEINFIDYDFKFDFNKIRNCHFLEKNKKVCC